MIKYNIHIRLNPNLRNTQQVFGTIFVPLMYTVVSRNPQVFMTSSLSPDDPILPAVMDQPLHPAVQSVIISMRRTYSHNTRANR